MKRTPADQSGFVPLLIVVLIVVGAAIYVVYARVLRAQT
jgi:hypothetical protein